MAAAAASAAATTAASSCRHLRASALAAAAATARAAPLTSAAAPRARSARLVVGGHHKASASSAAASVRDFRELPVLQHSALEQDFEGFAAELREACLNVGFFVLAGLPPRTAELHSELLRAAQAFFALPAEEKGRIDYQQSPHFRGYMWQGAENTAGRRDEREQIEFGHEEPAAAAPASLAPLFDRLRGPNQWPGAPPELKPVVLAWLEDMEALSRALTRALSASLGFGVGHLDALFEAPHVQAKLVHYPAPNLAEQGLDHTEAGLGVGAHSDSGFLTLLLQDDVGGLEVLNSAGCWVPAPPLPGSLVCNLGEVIQLLTRGTYLSTVHRVQRPHSRGRLSAPYFWNPSLDVVIEPLALPSSTEEVVMREPGSERPSDTENRMLPSYGMNAFKSLARSHPQVFARHHPDLQVLPDGRVVRR